MSFSEDGMCWWPGGEELSNHSGLVTPGSGIHTISLSLQCDNGFDNDFIPKRPGEAEDEQQEKLTV